MAIVMARALGLAYHECHDNALLTSGLWPNQLDPGGGEARPASRTRPVSRCLPSPVLNAVLVGGRRGSHSNRTAVPLATMAVVRASLRVGPAAARRPQLAGTAAPHSERQKNEDDTEYPSEDQRFIPPLPTASSQHSFELNSAITEAHGWAIAGAAQCSTCDRRERITTDAGPKRS
jgi:hypothetical protein